MKRYLVLTILAALALVGLSGRRAQIRSQADPALHGSSRSSLLGTTASTLVFKDCVLQNLGAPGNRRCEAVGINASGWVVGEATVTGGRNHAFLFREGGMIDLGTLPGGDLSAARAINKRGQVAGLADLSDGHQRAVLCEAGRMQDLGTLGLDSEAYAINDAGQVAGSSTLPDGSIHAFLYSGGKMRDLGTLGGYVSEARGINNAGQVVGWSRTGDGMTRAFLYDAAGMRDLGTLGGRECAAYGINAAGDVVGAAEVSPYGRHAFLFRGGRMRDLGTLGGRESVAFAINNRGEVVGTSRTSGDKFRAFLYAHGMMTDLNRWISPGSGWELTTACAIDEARQIAGEGSFRGLRRGFLLTPRTASTRSSRSEGNLSAIPPLVCRGGILRDLGTLGGRSSEVHALNALGQAVGVSHTANGYRASLFRTDGVVDLSPAGSWSRARDINNTGQVVGLFAPLSGAGCRAFLITGSTLQDLGTLGGHDSEATAINVLGHVVGWAHTPTGDEHAFLYQRGRMQDLGTLGGGCSRAYGLNDAGQVVGESQLGDGRQHAFLCSSGKMRDLGTLGGENSTARDINDAGQVVGGATTAHSEWHAFRCARGPMVDLNVPWSRGSEAYGINAAGDVISSASPDPDTEDHAFLWNRASTALPLLPLSRGLSRSEPWRMQRSSC